MTLKLRASPPPFVPVKLGRDAFFRLRPASAAEVDAAAAEAGNKLAALMLGGEDARALAALLPELDLGELVGIADPGAVGELDARLRSGAGLKSKIELLTDRLVLIGLIMRCHDGWTGVADEAGTVLPEPHAGAVALLLLDASLRALCHNAIYARYHMEADEGNASAASPTGGAAAATTIAHPAAPSAAPVPAAPAAAAASAAPK